MFSRLFPFLASIILTGAIAEAQLAPPGTQFWSQDSPGIWVALEPESGFGQAVAAGDFDCDGFEDLAIGTPLEDLTAGDDAGRVVVLYGGPAGVTTEGIQVLGQNDPEIVGTANPLERFGFALAAGDFDNNGCSDLAVGVPGDTAGVVDRAGGVNVFYGNPDGLSFDDDVLLNQNVGTIADSAESFDYFGWALAVGDFNDDGIDDLAIGAPGESFEGAGPGGSDVFDAGMVHVLFGSNSGLQIFGSPALARGTTLFGDPQSWEYLGLSLAAGDFIGWPGDELAIGAPYSDLAGIEEAGVVVLVSDIPGQVFDAQWSQDSNDVPGVAESDDLFGSSLAGGDFNGDGWDELAVGVPGEDRQNPLIMKMGALNILDFVGGNHLFLTQNDLAPEQEEEGDEFGFALAAGDFNADGVVDLAVSAALEDLGPIPNGGLVHVLNGELGTGLTDVDAQIWLQTINPSEEGDLFGYAMAAGRFAGHSGDDLAIGAPGETIGSAERAGGVNLIYSATLFFDGFESSDVGAWSSSVGDGTQ